MTIYIVTSSEGRVYKEIKHELEKAGYHTKTLLADVSQPVLVGLVSGRMTTFTLKKLLEASVKGGCSTD